MNFKTGNQLGFKRAALVSSIFVASILAGLGVSDACAGDTVGENAAADATVPADINALHQKFIVLDSHLDTPVMFHTPSYNFLNRGSWFKNGTHVDYPRMNEGGLDGGFWVIFTRQGELTEEGFIKARQHARLRQIAIREFAAKYHEKVALAFSADDVAKIIALGKKVVFQSMENAYPLGTDLTQLDDFYQSGLRMIGPVHFRNNQFGDSATDEAEHNGLTPLGVELVERANALGMVVDASHASDAATLHMIKVSKSPIILSHTSADAVYSHPRNVPDDLLRALAQSGGVIQLNIFGGYLEKLIQSQKRQAASEELGKQLLAKYGTRENIPEDASREAFAALNESAPASRSTYKRFMEHAIHVLSVVGPDHVGISGDWDGGGGVSGMDDISTLQKITRDLMAEGYSEQDLENIWSGNMLRLVKQAEEGKSRRIRTPNILN